MNHKEKKKIVAAVLFCLCGLVSVLFYVRRQGEEASVLQPTAEPFTVLKQETVVLEETVKEAEPVYVHVCGAVKEEGVYALAAGSRGMDAVKAAGGFLEEAATSYCNLAEVLRDGSKLYIPTKEEVETGTIPKTEENAGKTEDGLVNINTADKETLMTLAGIGEAKAESIIRYRTRAGGFLTPEELMNVSGIGQALFDAVSSRITVE